MAKKVVESTPLVLSKDEHFCWECSINCPSKKVFPEDLTPVRCLNYKCKNE